MPTHFDDLDLFCTVVNAGSFYKAARQKGLPHSTVSRRIAALESALGQRLIERTTRQMHVTETGEQLFKQCSPLLQALNVAVSDSLDVDGELHGPLSVTMPTRVGLDYMGEILIQFSKCHPHLELDIRLENAFTDLIAENIDVALRVGPLPDSSLIASKLWDIPFVLVAHRDTIAHFGVDPENIALSDLADLPCAVAAPQTRWLFESSQQKEIIVQPNAKLRANDLSLALEAAIHTQVFAYAPKIVFQNLAGCQQLAILRGTDWTPQTRTLYAVYAPSRRYSKKVKAVVDYAKSAYQTRYPAGS